MTELLLTSTGHGVTESRTKKMKFLRVFVSSMKRLLLVNLHPSIVRRGHVGIRSVDFTGMVSQDPLLDPDDPFGGSIAFGTLFSGSYVFESTTPDGDLSANGGSYTSPGGMLSVTIGGNDFRRH